MSASSCNPMLLCLSLLSDPMYLLHLLLHLLHFLRLRLHLHLLLHLLLLHLLLLLPPVAGKMTAWAYRMR
jgi:hypothetical protein